MNQNWLVDTHCHLDLTEGIQGNPRREDNLPIKSITVTNAPSFYEHNVKLFKLSQNIRVALGLHPELVPQYSHELVQFEQLLQSTRYVGEIGLDGSKQYGQHFRAQVEVFSQIVALVAAADKKILTVHSRNAVKDTVDILAGALKNKNCKVIFHWFTGSLKDLDAAIAQGYYFSINHKMANTKSGKEIIRTIPTQRILTETDAPFTLSMNDSREQAIRSTIKSIADIKHLNEVATAQLIFQNFKDLLS